MGCRTSCQAWRIGTDLARRTIIYIYMYVMSWRGADLHEVRSNESRSALTFIGHDEAFRSAYQSHCLCWPAR
jgi:hypothetical protein